MTDLERLSSPAGAATSPRPIPPACIGPCRSTRRPLPRALSRQPARARGGHAARNTSWCSCACAPARAAWSGPSRRRPGRASPRSWSPPTPTWRRCTPFEIGAGHPSPRAARAGARLGGHRAGVRPPRVARASGSARDPRTGGARRAGRRGRARSRSRDDPPSLGSETRCAYCGGRLPAGRAVNFCPHCGQNQTILLCPECRTEVEPGWKHCVNCGRAVSEA